MELLHEFTVPTDPDEALALLRNIELLAPCMPGATLEAHDGTSFTGHMKLKVGAVQLTYKGTGRMLESPAADRVLPLEFEAKETRGAGGAAARVTCRVEPVSGGARVIVATDLDITGRPAQFGRGVISEIGDRVVGAFAANVAQLLEDGTAAAPSYDGAPSGLPAQSTSPAGAPPLDVMAVAGPVLLRRALPVAGGVGIALLAFWIGRLSTR